MNAIEYAQAMAGLMKIILAITAGFGPSTIVIGGVTHVIYTIAEAIELIKALASGH